MTLSNPIYITSQQKKYKDSENKTSHATKTWNCSSIHYWPLLLLFWIFFQWNSSHLSSFRPSFPPFTCNSHLSSHAPSHLPLTHPSHTEGPGASIKLPHPPNSSYSLAKERVFSLPTTARRLNSWYRVSPKKHRLLYKCMKANNFTLFYLPIMTWKNMNIICN